MSMNIYSSTQMQQWDKFTIENEPIASVDLMERAATLSAKSILGRHSFESVSIFCGPGNNGGDGLVIARLLAESGKKVELLLLDFAPQTEDFKSNFKRLPKNIKPKILNEQKHQFTCESELIVDAIFGSGLNRPVAGWIASVIASVNALEKKVIAIDIPSGLFAVDNSENSSFPNVIKAFETLTFMSPKMVFFYEEYYKYVGHFRIIDIGLHPDFLSDSSSYFVQGEDIHFKVRGRFDHKGTSGCLYLIAGFEHMTGAAIIASKAAMKAGSRYLYTACAEEGKAALNAAIPETIWVDPASNSVPTKSNAVAIGPGLGKSEESLRSLKQALQSNLPIVIDADAINLIAENPQLKTSIPKDAIMTPHMGELERLIGSFKSPEKRLEAQIKFSIEHKVYILQKGAFSKLTTPEGKVFVNSSGNPGMSTAGMGDALTGIIGAFLAQGYTAQKSAIYGMYLHGLAADVHAKDHGEIGLLASDVIDQLPKLINNFAH